MKSQIKNESKKNELSQPEIIYQTRDSDHEIEITT